MKLHKYGWYTLSSILLMIILIGCNPQDEVETSSTDEVDEEESSGELRMAMSAQPPTLDPHITTAVVTRDISRHMFETLVTLNSEQEIIPMLADTVEESEDGKTYTFHLREGVLFHNGEEMTADDVVASMNRWVENVQGGQALFDGASFEKRDEYTVDLQMEEPSGLTLHVLAATNQFAAIMPKDIIDSAPASGVEEHIGTGPYEFEEWAQDQHVHFTKYENYEPVDLPADGLSGEKEVLVDDLYFDIVTDPTTRLNGLQTGEYDIAENLPTTDYEHLNTNPELELDIPIYGHQVLIFEKKDGLFSNVNLRRAVNFALDLDAIAMGSFHHEDLYGLGSSYMPEDHTWYSEAGEEFYNSGNLEEAEKLLEEEGYDGEEITFLTTRDYEHIYNASVVIQQQLEEIGMNVELEVYDWATLLDLRGDPEAWELMFTGFPNVSTPVELLAFTSEYYADFSNDEIPELFSSLHTAPSTEEAEQIWDELQGLAWEDLPVVKVSDFSRITAISESVEGFTSLDGPILWNTSTLE